MSSLQPIRLTAENFKKGFLIDEQWMGGVTEDPEKPGFYAAFILSHETGEYLGYHPGLALETALQQMNAIARDWKYESTSSCGMGKCGVGQCGTESCPKGSDSPCC
jgi:hypothetical protein